MRPPTRCPVCGDTSIEAVKHPQAFKVSTKQTAAYRCSQHHTFYAMPREVERARLLCGKARSARTGADEQIARARSRRGEIHTNVASIVHGFERIDIEEAVQKVRDTVRRSREMHAKLDRTTASPKELSEQVRQSVDDAKRNRTQRMQRQRDKRNHTHTE